MFWWEEGELRGMTLGTGAHSCSGWLQGAEMGQVGASHSKTIQLDIRKNFLPPRAGLEAVSSPVVIQLEQGDWPEQKGTFLSAWSKTLAWKVSGGPEASSQYLWTDAATCGVAGASQAVTFIRLSLGALAVVLCFVTSSRGQQIGSSPQPSPSPTPVWWLPWSPWQPP